jgi:hypothetical protein
LQGLFRTEITTTERRIMPAFDMKNMSFLERLVFADAQTPPVLVRLFILMGYLGCFVAGLYCLVHPFATPEESMRQATVCPVMILTISVTYFIDSALAASHWSWCCMRSIPPLHVVKHHFPYVVG